MDKKEIVEPGFDVWASSVYTYYDVSKIAEALKQAYGQGYYLGHREGRELGYQEGLETGWQRIWDKDNGFTGTGD